MASTSVKVVLLDIEGTVCPISFVKDVLFPYAVKALPGTLKTQWDEPSFAKYRDAFPAEHSSSQEAFVSHFNDLVERDVKISYLKSLQGYLWEEGYHSGEIKAPLFEDVTPKIQKWHKEGIKIMIYSSGSVAAQKLLFKHTNAEPTDLSPYISDWFDTVNAGLKMETASYKTITGKYPDIPVEEWLFLSDNVKEVDAAIEAGLQSMVVERPGNAELSEEARKRLQVIETFDVFEDDFTVRKQLAGQKRDRPDDETAENDASKDEPAAEEAGGAAEEEDTQEAKRLRTSKETETTAAAQETE